MKRTDYQGVAWILVSTIVLVVLNLVPLGDSIVYPIRLFVTYVHEFCHAIAAILTGGSVHGFAVNPDTSGVTVTSGGIGFIVSSAGYVGTAILGMLCVLALQSNFNPRYVLVGFTAILFLALAMSIGPNFTTVLGLIIVGVIVVITLKGPKPMASFTASLFSTQLMFGAFYDMKTLIFLSTTGTHTDALNMQVATGVPAIVWAVLWMGLSAYGAWRLFIR